MKKIIDDDGENLAVRQFLALYGCCNSPSVKQMREHLSHDGFDGCWPDWCNTYDHHLTKAGAQNWLRHLFKMGEL